MATFRPRADPKLTDEEVRRFAEQLEALDRSIADIAVRRRSAAEAQAEVLESVTAVEEAQRAVTEPAENGKPATVEAVRRLEAEVAELRKRVAVQEERDAKLDAAQEQSAHATLELANEMRLARLASIPDAVMAEKRARISTLVGVGGLVIGAAGVVVSLL